MYNFEKVTSRADRHERTCEPSRDIRSEKKIRTKRSKAACSKALIFTLAPKVPGDTVTFAVSACVQTTGTQDVSYMTKGSGISF